MKTNLGGLTIDQITGGVDNSTIVVETNVVVKSKKILFEDNFLTNDWDATYWTETITGTGDTGGTIFTNFGGAYVQTGGGAGSNASRHTLKYFSNPNLANFDCKNKLLVVEFKFKIINQASLHVASGLGFASSTTFGTSNDSIGLRLRTAGSPAQWEWFTDSGSVETAEDISVGFTDGDIQHIRMEFKEDEMKCYLNGTLDATLTTNMSNAYWFFIVHVLNVGANTLNLLINDLSITEFELV